MEQRISSFLEAMAIFIKYDNSLVTCGYDGLIRTYIHPEQVSEEDQSRLLKLGWHPYEHYFCHF